jgi:hypothetical protein
MNKKTVILIHDVATAMFLVPFSALCIAEVFFGYIVYPMFLTHALTLHMSYDLVWIILQPEIIPSLRGLIILHHLVALLYLLRPLMHPEESYLTSLAALVEIDTSILMFRRFTPRWSSLYRYVNNLYYLSNLFIRVYYELFLTFLVFFTYSREDFYTKAHMLGCQIFINVFSCGICALTYSKKNPALQ